MILQYIHTFSKLWQFIRYGSLKNNFCFDTILERYSGTTRTTEIQLCLWVHIISPSLLWYRPIYRQLLSKVLMGNRASARSAHGAMFNYHVVGNINFARSAHGAMFNYRLVGNIKFYLIFDKYKHVLNKTNCR